MRCSPSTGTRTESPRASRTARDPKGALPRSFSPRARLAARGCFGAGANRPQFVGRHDVDDGSHESVRGVCPRSPRVQRKRPSRLQRWPRVQSSPTPRRHSLGGRAWQLNAKARDIRIGQWSFVGSWAVSYRWVSSAQAQRGIAVLISERIPALRRRRRAAPRQRRPRVELSPGVRFGGTSQRVRRPTRLRALRRRLLARTPVSTGPCGRSTWRALP